MPLSNSQYDEIMRNYESRQIKNQHAVQSRIEEVYQKDQRLKQIDDNIASCSVKQGRRLLEGDQSALSELHDQIAQFRQQRASILESLGYPESYFEPPYECPDCKDTGYVNSRRCHCFKQKAIDLVYTQSNIRNILLEENFDHFSFDFFSEAEVSPATGKTSLEMIQDAVSISKKFIANFDSAFSNLFFYGDTGVGKTFLSNCIAKELLDTGHSVIYFTAFQLFDIFEKNTFHRATDADMIAAHQNIFDCDLLIIDDLGTEVPNSFTTSQLFLCLNERILRKKSTIISTNLSVNKVAEIYSERTFSRVSSAYQLVKFFGLDIRIQKKLRM